jgi:hypothetical protein
MIANHILKIEKASISHIHIVILFPFSSIADASFPLKMDLFCIYSPFFSPPQGSCHSGVNCKLPAQDVLQSSPA